MLKSPTAPPTSIADPVSTVNLATQQESRFRLWMKACAVAVLLFGGIAVIGAIASRAIPESETGATLTHTIARGDLIVSVTEQGTLEVSNNVEVRSKVWGWKTVNWVIESGTDVKEGDLLVELDASEMEKKVDDMKINFHNARADKITTESNVSVAKKSITEYVQATFIEELGAINQEIFDAEQAVKQAELSYKSAERLAAKGLIKDLQLMGDRFKLDSAVEKLKLKKTRRKALEKFKREKQVEKLESDLRAAEARLEAASARVDLAQTNVDQHEEQLRFHTIVAPQDGMVIHPKAAAHRSAPDVEEGANVHTNQVLLIMPDLEQMQVKLGVHESMIDRVEPGLVANVTVGDATLVGKVSEVAKVTKPATWYTGNVVKFDTIVAIEGHQGLKPGLSAEVEVIIAEHKDVLTIPVAAIVETGEEHHCWVKSSRGEAMRRPLKLGDSNDLFVIVESGLKEGDEVVLNPLAYVDEAQEEVLKPLDENKPSEPDQLEPGDLAKPPKPAPQDRSPNNLTRPTATT